MDLNVVTFQTIMIKENQRLAYSLNMVHDLLTDTLIRLQEGRPIPAKSRQVLSEKAVVTQRFRKLVKDGTLRFEENRLRYQTFVGKVVGITKYNDSCEIELATDPARPVRCFFEGGLVGKTFSILMVAMADETPVTVTALPVFNKNGMTDFLYSTDVRPGAAEG